METPPLDPDLRQQRLDLLMSKRLLVNLKIKRLESLREEIDAEIEKLNGSDPQNTLAGSHPISSQLNLDEVTLASEASLAEAWLSPEDDHWDELAT